MKKCNTLWSQKRKIFLRMQRERQRKQQQLLRDFDTCTAAHTYTAFSL